VITRLRARRFRAGDYEIDTCGASDSDVTSSNTESTLAIVLIAKLDVASADAVRRTDAVLDEAAPHAERTTFPRDDAGALAMTA
jgi:hypothetical protein